MISYAIAAGWIWAMTGDAPEVLPNHTLLVEDDRIVAVVPEFTGEAKRRIDAPTALVLPGFVNAHVHVGSSAALRGLPEDLAAGSQSGAALYQIMSPITDLLYGEEFRTSFRALVDWDIVALLRGGTTTILNEAVVDLEYYLDAAERLGVRTYASSMFPASNQQRGAIENGKVVYASADEANEQALSGAIAAFHRHDGRAAGRIRLKLSPHAPDTVAPAVLRSVATAANELGCPITIHAAQSRNEVEQIRTRFRRSPIRHLYQCGVLGERTLITHATYPDDGDLELLRETGTAIVHCPLRKVREAVSSPYQPYLDAGVRATIGSDAYNCDYLTELRAAANLGKLASGSIARPSARDVLASATYVAADALGRPDLGRIRPGAKADILVIDLSHPNRWPVFDPLRSVVYYGSSSDIQTVLIDGRAVIDGGSLVVADERQLGDAAATAARDLWQTTAAQGRLSLL